MNGKCHHKQHFKWVKFQLGGLKVATPYLKSTRKLQIFLALLYQVYVIYTECTQIQKLFDLIIIIRFNRNYENSLFLLILMTYFVIDIVHPTIKIQYKIQHVGNQELGKMQTFLNSLHISFCFIKRKIQRHNYDICILYPILTI